MSYQEQIVVKTNKRGGAHFARSRDMSEERCAHVARGISGNLHQAHARAAARVVQTIKLQDY